MDEPITWDNVQALMGELRAMARSLLARERDGRTLQPTALILTALRRQKPADSEWNEVSWPNRAYFFRAMYRAMWRALIDYARTRMTKGPVRAVQVEQLHLENLAETAGQRPEQILALSLALQRLRARYPAWAELVEHRYISGCTVEESARLMGVSERTVRRRWEREWERARSLLCREVLHILNKEDIPLEKIDD